MGPPRMLSWFIKPINYSYLRAKNHSDIGVMCTNLAIPTLYGLPSGKRLHNYGKSPLFNGKTHYFNGHFQ